MWQGAPYFDMGREAHIRVIPKKKVKDPLQPSFYRPISLINVDSKLLSKIRTNRLADILPSLINPNQLGFVKGRSGEANIRKVLVTLEHSHRNMTQDNVIITLDGEKAFDNIDLGWLFHVMEAMGFQGNFMTFLAAQWAHPMARINTNTVLSKAFVPQKGTRQGCPLCPLLFNIVLKPLARSILQSNDMKGMQFSAAQNLKLALFANDVLIFTSSPDTDL